MPHVFDLGVDGRTLAFTIGLVVLCTVLFGMAPALRAGRIDLNDSLKQGSRGTGGPGHHRLRAALIVGEVAVSLVMLVAAGLLVRSFAQLQQVDLGFTPGQVATMTISLPDYRYPDVASYRRYVDEALAGVRQVPGVRSAGFVNVLPFSGYNGERRYSIDGEPPPTPGQEPAADYRVATPGYFTALGIPLGAGRTFDSRDRNTTAPVAIVNRTLVRRAFGDRNPLGRMPVPQFRDSTAATIRLSQCFNDALCLGWRQPVRTLRHGYRPLRVEACGDAWNAECRRFLLDSPRICKDHARVCHEAKKAVIL